MNLDEYDKYDKYNAMHDRQLLSLDFSFLFLSFFVTMNYK
jgi:hypothetical protein